MLNEGDVQVRPIVMADLENLQRWQSDPAIMTGWALPQPILAPGALEADILGRFRSFDHEGHFIIESPDGPVGRIGFGHFDRRHASVELSLYIGEASQQGKGYAGLAIQALVKYLFRQRGVHRVELTTLIWNDRARRLYTYLGFQEEGTLRDLNFFDGAWQSEVLMSLLATDPVPWLQGSVDQGHQTGEGR